MQTKIKTVLGASVLAICLPLPAYAQANMYQWIGPPTSLVNTGTMFANQQAQIANQREMQELQLEQQRAASTSPYGQCPAGQATTKSAISFSGVIQMPPPIMLKVPTGSTMQLGAGTTIAINGPLTLGGNFILQGTANIPKGTELNEAPVAP